MPADASIFQQYLQPVRSVADYSADMDKAEGNQLQLAAARLQGKQALQAVADDKATRLAYQQSAGDPKAYRNALVQAGNYKAVQALDAADLERQKTTAETGLKTAQAAEATQKTSAGAEKQRYDAALHHAQGLAYVQTPEDVQTYIQQGIAKGVFPPMTPEQVQQKIASFKSVDDFKQQAAQASIPVLERFKVEAENARNKLTNDTSRLNNQETNSTSRANNASTNATTMRGQDMTNARAKDALDNKGQPKPLPAAALKMQQEGLDAIGTASGINADLSAVEQQIQSGKLSFGPISNVVSGVRNAVGMSNEESRNLASFKTNLEKLRNDSLRLNKGVQTDGDAQRAWNELFQNINDTEFVKQRLGEIKRLNERAVQLRKLDIEGVRANYNQPTLDTSAYSSQPATLNGGSGGGKPGPSSSKVVDFGSLK